MNKKSFAIAAVAVACVIFSAGLVIADDSAEEQVTGAGGGGWFISDQAKDTFGFYLDNTDIAMSEFVLQARDVGVTVHAYEFDDIVFNYDAVGGTGSAEAWGVAYVAGVEADFHLLVQDNGPRSADYLMLELSNGYDGTWETMTGLGGGQIWVYME